MQVRVWILATVVMLAAIIVVSCGDDGTTTGTGTTTTPNIVVTDSATPDSDLQIPFGNVTAGSASDHTVTVANTGTANLVMGSIATANPLAAPFSVTANTCSGQTLAPSGTCTVTIRFAPTAANSFSDSFGIPSNDPDTATVTVSVSGTGTALPVPNISVTDSVAPNNDFQIPFGNVAAGGTSDHTVTVTNIGTANLVMGSIASTDPLAAPFSITADTCSGQTIAPSGTCSLTIRFAPTTENSYSDSFNIPNDDPDTPAIAITASGSAGTFQLGGAIQGTPLVLANTAGTLAGFSRIGSTDATGTSAKFNAPRGVTTDGTNLYVADMYNHTIRKIVIATGEVTTFAGTANSAGSADGAGAAARFTYPIGICTDGTNLYVADTGNNKIRKIVIATGEVTTLAGSGSSGSTDGTGPGAQFYSPYGVATDGTNVYVADRYNNAIRKIVIATRVVTTLAGLAGSSGSTNGTGSAARFYYPCGVTVEGGNLYVSDTYNHMIRQVVIATGEVTTLAGQAASGSTDGTGLSAKFGYPYGITSDGTNLYVAESDKSTVRKIVIATRAVTTFAGTAGSYGSTDGTGAAARFDSPYGIATDGTNLYVADTDNHAIRKIVISTRVVTTFAGITDWYGSADGTGPAARFNAPYGITTDGTSLYVSETNNHTIRKIVISTGEVSTLAGAAGLTGSTDGTGVTARFNLPSGITTDGTNLYVADSNNCTIRKIVISTGEVTTLAGTTGVPGSTDGTGTAATLSSPRGITTDGTNLYVTETTAVRKVVISTGAVTTLAGTVGTIGSTDGTGTAAKFHYPRGITTDGTNLYVADWNNNTIRQIVISTGAVTTLAGGGAALPGSTNGIGTAARFTHPVDVTTDGTNLYVADTDNHTIRKIVIATRAVTTLAGSGSVGSADGTGTAAKFNYPKSITTDGVSLFVTDSSNNTIRKIQ